MDDCISRRGTASGVQTPVAYLTCNFSPPIGDEPALFTHDEVITLFHEFGHGLHHMLTQVDYPGVSGISGVAWDAVELPSQFMENWCWEREALDLISGHYQTGEKIPAELYERMQRAKNFQSAMQMLRQLEFALFDFRMHRDYDPKKGARITPDPGTGAQAGRGLQPPEFNRFANSFTHIFAGGYAAGYYSYKWAEVLSADAFSAFEESGIFNRETGEKFLREHPRTGWLARTDGTVRRVPRPRTDHRRPAATFRTGSVDGRARLQGEGRDRSMKIATWNVNSLKVRLPHMLDWLTAAEPDVLCLQETKLTDEKFPRDADPRGRVSRRLLGTEDLQRRRHHQQDRGQRGHHRHPRPR